MVCGGLSYSHTASNTTKLLTLQYQKGQRYACACSGCTPTTADEDFVEGKCHPRDEFDGIGPGNCPTPWPWDGCSVPTARCRWRWRTVTVNFRSTLGRLDLFHRQDLLVAVFSLHVNLCQLAWLLVANERPNNHENIDDRKVSAPVGRHSRICVKW